MKKNRGLILFILFLMIILFISKPQKIKNKIAKNIKKKEHQEKQVRKTKIVKVKLVKLNKLKKTHIKKQKPKKEIKKTSQKNNKTNKKKAVADSPKFAEHQSRHNKKSNARKTNGNDFIIIGKYNLPITSYLKYMRRLGGKVVVYDKLHKKILCSLKEGRFYDTGELSGFSVKARKITSDYPQVKNIFRKVVNNFGKGEYEILLLLPIEQENRFCKTIEKLLHNNGINKNKILSVIVKYYNSSYGLKVKIVKVNTVNKTIKTNLNFIF